MVIERLREQKELVTIKKMKGRRKGQIFRKCKKVRKKFEKTQKLEVLVHVHVRARRVLATAAPSEERPIKDLPDTSYQTKKLDRF